MTETNTLFDSLDDMLSIEKLSALERRTVPCIEVTPWIPPKYHTASGYEFLACATDNRGCALLMRDVEEPLQRLERWRPEGLCQLNLDALARFPRTLIHGPRRENIGLIGDNTSRILLIDWQFASAPPPAVDLAWLLCFYGPSPIAKGSVIDLYRDQLALRLGSIRCQRVGPPRCVWRCSGSVCAYWRAY